MENKEFLITLAEIEVAFRFHFSGTGMLFRSYEIKKTAGGCTGQVLSVDPEEILEYVEEQSCQPEFAEYCCAMMTAADFLTEKGYAMFHGVAFLYGEGAYILTAPSGTGKSTQFRNLRRLYGKTCRIINGDKPILGPGKDGSIIVYPSPWNGKEGWAGREHAPLRGLVLLEQGNENIIRKMNQQDAVVPVLEQFLYTAQSRESVRTVCRMADSMISNVPMYHLTNKGDLASTKILFDCIKREEEQWQ